MILCFRFHVCKDTERESIEMEMKFIKYTVCWRMKIVRWKWAGPLGFRIYWSGLALGSRWNLSFHVLYDEN